MLRKVILAIGSIAFLVVLLFGPGKGTVVLYNTAHTFAHRLLVQRDTPAESAELAQLACFQKSLSKVPDGARARLYVADDDAYLVQRFSDIGYPRLRLTATESTYGIYVNVQPPASDSRVSQTICGPVKIEVVRHG